MIKQLKKKKKIKQLNLLKSKNHVHKKKKITSKQKKIKEKRGWQRLPSKKIKIKEAGNVVKKGIKNKCDQKQCG